VTSASRSRSPAARRPRPHREAVDDHGPAANRDLEVEHRLAGRGDAARRLHQCVVCSNASLARSTRSSGIQEREPDRRGAEDGVELGQVAFAREALQALDGLDDRALGGVGDDRDQHQQQHEPDDRDRDRAVAQPVRLGADGELLARLGRGVAPERAVDGVEAARVLGDRAVAIAVSR
jgi:hypothetical protein